MKLANLDMKVDERSNAYTQQVLDELDLSSDSISLNKDKFEEIIFSAYKKGFQKGVDVITEALETVYPNLHFVKKD